MPHVTNDLRKFNISYSFELTILMLSPPKAMGGLHRLGNPSTAAPTVHAAAAMRIDVQSMFTDRVSLKLSIA